VVHKVLKTALHTPEDLKVSDMTLTKKRVSGRTMKSNYGILITALSINSILISQRTDTWVSVIH